jgi:hypothetical protein
MVFCHYDHCEGGREMEEARAWVCSHCGAENPMHAPCVTAHNSERHAGKAAARPLDARRC